MSDWKADYEAAYAAANPGTRARVVDLDGGWYAIRVSDWDEVSKHRKSEILVMTGRLEERAESRERL